MEKSTQEEKVILVPAAQYDVIYYYIGHRWPNDR